MEKSHIEWTDHTFNPWIGCTKVSPGCVNCYAEARDQRFADGIHWGKGAPRQRTSKANWLQPLKWNRQCICVDCGKIDQRSNRKAHQNAAGEWCGKHDETDGILSQSFRRPRVFCASLADWLDDEVPIDWLLDHLDLVRRTPNLDWQLLSKRPQNWDTRIHAVLAKVENVEGDWPDREPQTDLGRWLNNWTGGQAPDNVWIGTTVEDQARADERIPLLLSIPAKVRFLSCEPLLGPVEFSDVSRRSDAVRVLGQRALSGIHWVICGGESGPGARPMNPAWAQSIRNQCAAAGVPFFFKQWGSHAPFIVTPGGCLRYTPEEAARVERGEYIGRIEMLPVNKKTAGRLLDGREHNEFPCPQVAGATA